jgi:ArsR family transcriptional regulator
MQRETVNVFKALSDPNRVRIVKMLAERELCVCEVREILNLSVSTVSKHLTILRDAGLLVDSKEGKWVNFSLNASSKSAFVRAIIELITNSFDDDAAVRDDRKKVRKVDRRDICNA